MTQPQSIPELLELEGGKMVAGNPSVDQIVLKLKEDGAVCLQSFFDEPTVEKMRDEAAAALAKRREGRRTKRIYPKPRGSRRYPTLARVFNCDFFKGIAAGYDPKCRFFFDSGICVDHAVRPDKKITDVHFDGVRSLKFAIYLSDVDKKSAAFSYCLGSHGENTRFRKRHFLMGGTPRDIPNVPGPGEHYELQSMEGPRGTVIVFDTDGFHSAGRLQEGHERLLVRTRILLNGWFDSTVVRSAVQLNPLRFLAPSLAPNGRLATRGTSRIKHT